MKRSRRRKLNKKAIVFWILVCLFILVIVRGCTKKKEETNVVVEPKTTETKKEKKETTTDSPVYSKKGIIVVNKKHGVSKDYAPGENEEAGEHIRELIAQMQAEGYDISSSYSGYRSYEYQVQLYQGYVDTYGQEEADRFSARPGYSEHQTGLAFDLMNTSGELVTSDAEAKWIAEHAHTYGFIVRYTSENEEITGYQPEPWHLRYVGKKAKDIYTSGLTLEEYLDVEGGTSYE